MKQLAQKLRDGTMLVLDVPPPTVMPGRVIVRNHFSLVSPGTEGSTVRAARRSLIGKARERPQQVQQVLEKLVREGPVQTFRAVAKKLEAYSPLGYSSAGTVVAVASDVKGLQAGDLVACGGAGYASHAEFVAVPRNLCVKLPPGARLDEAAYNTLGAIALQGVRQAGLSVGETGVIIGLGLLGQLTALILRASGARVVALDIDDTALQLARRGTADVVLRADDARLTAVVQELTDGIGADAAIITAATSSLGPVNLAGALLRKRGTVVIVGNVPTGFDREPHYYRKELSLRMSCSYGPGRYDPAYEEHGHDYPPGYVRWTENRNMQAFQDLLCSRRINIDHLTTHRFKLENAAAAYDLVLGRSEPVCGIIIEYDAPTMASSQVVDLQPARVARQAGLGVGFIGAGSYALGHLLPNLAAVHGLTMTQVMTSSGTSSRSVADRYRFRQATASANTIFDDEETDVVFIATRHDSHAHYALEALKAGKHVFVEKPLCLREVDLDAIEAQVAKDTNSNLLAIGFNRRFAPLARVMKDVLGTGPMSVIYRVNAGAIAADSWMQDPEVGGGRLIGEGCHFLDFALFLADSRPVTVRADAMRDPANLEDTFSVTVSFENGSIATVCYLANGSRRLEKEYIEAHRAGISVILRDFKQLEVHGEKKTSARKLLSQDKGQAALVRTFIDAIRSPRTTVIPTRQMLDSTRLTLKAAESLRSGTAVRVFDQI